ncbi:MAG: transposase [Candidatus Thiodiazotropha sp. (ex Lucinoma borealis)]|nr:transposase [Candidatus Thiodiazotropha sp. (ex Lucinoma borealis)]MCU7867301.1 transposase [Candidatus Thiodiazotropha sp. (ex Lucinoma borealis)]
MPKKKQSAPYSEAFRREAVRRSEEEDTNAVEVAKELGINVNQIYNWRWQFKRLKKNIKPGKQFHSMKGVDYSKDESEELRKLRRKVAEQEEEIKFLKKATAYFAKQK